MISEVKLNDCRAAKAAKERLSVVRQRSPVRSSPAVGGDLTSVSELTQANSGPDLTVSTDEINLQVCV